VTKRTEREGASVAASPWISTVSEPTVVHVLAGTARRAPRAEALVEPGGVRADYATYWAAVQGFAARIEAGTTVGVVMRNSAAMCVVMFGVCAAGATLAPMNPRYTDPELRALLAEADVDVLVGDADTAVRLHALAADAGIDDVLTVDAAVLTPATVTRERLPAPDAIGMIQFTGGTTGRSKAVELTHAALVVNLAQRLALVPVRPDVERLVCVMPLYHSYAIHMGLFNMAVAGGALVVVPAYEPAAVLATLAGERATIFGGSPTLLADLVAHRDFATTDLSALTVTYSGAAPLPAPLLTTWERATGAPVVEGYGQSEAGPVVSFNPLHGERRPGSVGVPLPRTEVSIVDPATGLECHGVGEVGEIRVRGPQVMAGYRNRPDETARVLEGGWLHTGDLGSVDADGYLYVRGRLKDMLIVSGFNVYPAEIENTLLACPDVVEAAVVGRPDPRKGEVPVAFVRLDARVDDVSMVVETLHRSLSESLAAYKRPSDIVVVEALPKTSVGKIDKNAIQSSLTNVEEEP